MTRAEPPRFRFLKRWHLPTALERMRTPRRKRAPRRQGRKIRRLPRNGRQAPRTLDISIERRNRSHETSRIRMLRVRIKRPSRGRLHHTPGIHHRHPIRIPRHHPKIVRDENQRRVRLPRKFLQERQNLRLHGHVQGRRRLVGDDEPGPGKRAPSQSSPAAASRRRNDAGSRASGRPHRESALS